MLAASQGFFADPEHDNQQQRNHDHTDRAAQNPFQRERAVRAFQLKDAVRSDAARAMGLVVVNDDLSDGLAPEPCRSLSLSGASNSTYVSVASTARPFIPISMSCCCICLAFSCPRPKARLAIAARQE